MDTYGGSAPHGGGAFSGKDPSKVDRSAAYMARFLAKQVVARGWASRALVQLAYAIGVAEPVSFAVETFGTDSDPKRDVAARLTQEFDLRPQGIIETLNLLRPIYYPTAAYGHFGRTDLDLPWERVHTDILAPRQVLPGPPSEGISRPRTSLRRREGIGRGASVVFWHSETER